MIRKMLVASSLIMPLIAFGSKPVFNLVPQGPLPTSILPNSILTVNYTVTNQMPATLQANGLNYPPKGQTPIGVTQNTGVGYCPEPFDLGPGQSCTLSLLITANDLVGGKAVGGPEVCNSQAHPSRCSVPTPANQLNIQSGSYHAQALTLAAGMGVLSPFLVQSPDGGNSWAIPSLPNGNPSTGYFSSAACNNTLCIAGGQDQDNSYSLLDFTINGGGLWSRLNLSSDSTAIATNSNFNAAFCVDAGCFAIGGVPTLDVSVDPLMIYLENDGVTWTGVDLSGITTTGSLNAMDCVGTYCITVGSNNEQPLMAQSTNTGGSWASVSLGSTPDGGNLLGVSCSADLCIAGGAQTLAPNYPLLFQSSSLGGSWSPVTLSMLPAVVGTIYGTACTGSLCLAVGGTSSSSILLQNTGGSGAWVLATLPSGANAATVSFNSVSCSATICAAVGSDSGTGYPILVYTTNGGSTWNNFALSIQGVFNTVSCHGNDCLAGGINTGDGSGLLYQTSNAGVSWSVPTVFGAPAFVTYFGTSTP